MYKRQASYALLAEALGLVQGDWQLQIVGDGPARGDVEGLFERFGPRVRVIGARDAEALQGLYAEASALVWPGVNEAFGMVYLEAQSHGLPIVAQDRPGLRDVVAGPKARVEAGPAGLAARIEALLADPYLRCAEGAANRKTVAEQHLLGSAAARLDAVLGAL